ncbi:hypothetical protein BGX23_011899 [Mortierella sp. AD031]|nr:hypothetical protein BGX23_011899 [Mortierella sp. AD031]
MQLPPTRKGFRSHGIHEPLTTRIAGILRAYPDSTQIARELLQNSDDAGSTVQWYLLDHRDHLKHARTTNPSEDPKLRLFHDDLQDYMGPALLAGSDSVFEEKDFLSLKNLASSEKRGDESKIGQMGIGFNSIYHLTDCPSFISGDQFMMIEPHQRIFNGERSEFNEGAVRGNFVEGKQGLQDFPDQLQAFSVLEDIDFSKSYPGTIFRFPLRTPDQAKASALTKYACTYEQVRQMLIELKDEALKALLFLKHVQKIQIYERKEDQDTPTKLFEIEIVNTDEVKAQRLCLLRDFKRHVQSSESVNQDAVLECSVRPTYKLTHENGLTTQETWQVTTRIGNISKTRAAMLEDSNGDVNIADHKLIPWVGIAAPTEPGIKIDSPGLFCFLPVGGIQLPFPVHINGHFAVEQSRRDIWTNTDGKIKTQSSAGIEALWNVHLFDKQIPAAYTLFLESIGLDHGANYDLWPVSCGDGVGRDAVWKNMLAYMLSDILSRDCPVFFCGPKPNGPMSVESYSNLYIAGRDLDAYPLLTKALHAVTTLAEGVPDVVLEEIFAVVESLGMTSRILTSAMVTSLLQDTKKQWNLTVDDATRVEMLKYCLQDDKSVNLVGLPLLPLAGGSWVEFSRKQARGRFLVSLEVFKALSESNNGLVNLDVEGYPFEDIEIGCRSGSKSGSKSKRYWSTMPVSSIAERLKTVFDNTVYQNGVIPEGNVSQVSGQFPSDEWLTNFWNMAHSLSSAVDQRDLLSGLVGVHLIPIRRGFLAPLSKDCPVLYLNPETGRDMPVLRRALAVLDEGLSCQTLREIPMGSMSLLRGYLVDVSVGPRVLSVLAKVDAAGFQNLSPTDRDHLRKYLSISLSPRASLDSHQKRALRCLPVFEMYGDTSLSPLDTPSSHNLWKVAQGYHHTVQPWMPASVSLLAEEQPLKHHIRYLLDIPSLSKPEYLRLLVSQLQQRPENEWDAILSEVFFGYYEYKKKVDFTAQLHRLPYVQVQSLSMSDGMSPSPTRLRPGSVVEQGMSMYFTDDEAVFPWGIYAQPAFRGPLEELGMRFKFDAAFVQERLSTLFGTSSDKQDASHRKAALALYDQLNSRFSKEFLTKDLLSMVSSLPWIYIGSSDRCRPSECRPKEDRCLVGDQMPVAEYSFSNELLLEHMGWQSPPPLDKVLAHFSSILDRASSTVEEQDVRPIYQYLAGHIHRPASLANIKNTLRYRPWILISGTLYPVERVALKMEFNLSPHFVQVPASSHDELYLALGARQNVHRRDIETILKGVDSKYQSGERVSREDADLVCRLLRIVANRFKPTWSAELPVLTRNGTLKPAADVVYDDMNSRHRSTDFETLYTYLHDGISKDTAQKLQIAMFSARTWEESKDRTFEPFFQQEDIVDRIKGILNDYDPSGIFNEYLQNASDAGATKFSVMLDTRAYDKTKVLSKEMETWQGPALVFYNNAEFTEESFSALCRLGAGNKREDKSKIGRHGLGFNSAYHFTDVPSVISGHSLVIFDPHMSNLPKSRDVNGNLVAQKGHRYDIRKLSTEALVDQLQPYKGLFGCDMESRFNGTIFRIPLRLKGTESPSKSSFEGEGWTTALVQTMIQSWIEDAKIGMLFLNNVRTIDLSDGFNATTLSIIDIVSTSTGVGNVTSTGSLKWLVYTEDSMPIDTPQDIRNLSLKRHWSTHCGVAIPLGDDRAAKPCRGRLMVHLPTPIETKLPFHLHGGFALTTNRKTLAGGSDPNNQMFKWNSYLLEARLPLTTIRAYEQLLRWSFRPVTLGGPHLYDLNVALPQYFRRWPLKPTEGFATFLRVFLRVFLQHAYVHPVFPCRGHPSELPIVPVAGRDVILRGHIVPTDLESRVFVWLREGGCLVAETPAELQSLLKLGLGTDNFCPFKQIDCNLLRKRLRKDPMFIPRQMKSMTDKRWILEEILRPIDDSSSVVDEPLLGLAIVPLMNGEWKPLHASPVYYIATPDVRDLIGGLNQLVDMDVLDSMLLKRITRALVKSPSYGIEDLRLGVIASTFLAENPDGVSDDKWARMWEYLGKFDDLTPAHELPILKTTHGSMVNLARASGGLQISRASLLVDTIRILTEFFRRIGVAIFDASQHRNHVYFENLQVHYTNHRALELIAKNWPVYAASVTISTDEATHLRTVILRAQDECNRSVLDRLGDLPIWKTYGAQGSPLVAAKQAIYMKDHTSLDYLGVHPTILRDVQNVSLFKKMGATMVQAASLLQDYILPKFESQELRPIGNTKSAYLGLFRSIIATADRRLVESYTTVQVLKTSRCFLARDQSFRTLAQLIVPGEDLTENIFDSQQHRFPDNDLYTILVGRKYWLEFQGVSGPLLVEECANRILQEIAGGLVGAEQLLSRATRLVRHIYADPGNTNWMDPKWAIVPREISTEFPYNEHVPGFPRYMPFSALCFPVYRDYLWTQRAFFPQDLIPSLLFKTRCPNIGQKSWREQCQHLEVLVKVIAPVWTSTERQLAFKATLFKFYKQSEARVSESHAITADIRKTLREVLTVPYILNGDDKDTSRAESWVYPQDLVFGIEHRIGAHQQAHPSLLKYRNFLVAVGAKEMKHIEGQVKVSPRRPLGDLESQIINCFQTQDDHHGFMDVKFTFEGGKSILAHKVVLASTSEEIIRQLTGSWSLMARRDPSNPSVDVIEKEDDYAAFWGLLHFLYMDDLIGTNGPPTIPSAVGPLEGQQDEEDQLSQRVDYLMALQHLADFYRADRLKALIAQELMLPGKIMYSNVFDIRAHAEQNRDEIVAKFCNRFIAVDENALLIEKYIEDEIVAVQGKLVALDKYLGGVAMDVDDISIADHDEGTLMGGHGNSSAREALEMELIDLKESLKELQKRRPREE